MLLRTGEKVSLLFRCFYFALENLDQWVDVTVCSSWFSVKMNSVFLHSSIMFGYFVR